MILRSDEPDVGLLLFGVDGSLFGVDVGAVHRVVAAVEITPLPHAPSVVAGVVNVHGSVLPVLDLRWRLNGRHTNVTLGTKLIVTRLPSREIVLLVDHVSDVVEIPSAAVVSAATLAPGVGLLRGVASAPDGLVLIQDVEAMLTADEDARLEDALRRQTDE